MKKIILVLFTLSFIISNTLHSQSTEGLVACFDFLENADDCTPFENNGIVDGPELTTDRNGFPDAAYEFNGVDDKIVVPDDPSLHFNEEFTIVAWVMAYSYKGHTITRKPSTMAVGNNPVAFNLALSGTKSFVFTINTTEEVDGISTQSSPLINTKDYELNTWYRIIARKQQDTMYLTTNEFDTGLFTNYRKEIKGDIINESSPLLIGTRTAQAANTLDGKIDELKIYNRFLSLEEATGIDFSDGPIEEDTTNQVWLKASGGDLHTLAIGRDSSLWGWGNNEFNQVNQSTDSIQTPSLINSEFKWKNVYAGVSYSMALRNDGTLYAWGANEKAQLGLGYQSEKESNLIKVNEDTDWDTVATAGRYVLALKKDGTLWAWGDNFENGNYIGCLGNGSSENLNVPTKIGTDNDWTQISAYFITSMALKDDGSRWAWGANSTLSYGSGNNDTYDSPTKIAENEDIKSFSLGYTHGLAVKNNGTLWAWGVNNNGILGLGDTQDRISPTQVGSENDWKQCSASVWHSLALKNSGQLFAWGRNVWGLLGLGFDSDIAVSPMPAAEEFKFESIGVGGLHSFAFTPFNLYTWGVDDDGQLGREEEQYNFPHPVLRPDGLILKNTDLPVSKTKLQLYPNPASELLTIANFELDLEQVEIFNLQGELMNSAPYTEEIDIKHLDAGLYLLKTTTSKGEILSTKFIKQ